jgi:glycerol kinase
MAGFIASIDQGTTSTRCIVFDSNAAIRAVAQHEHRQISPRPGWVEQNANELCDAAIRVLAEAVAAAGGVRTLACIGITNQRETIVVWDADTREPLHHAIVWQDTRTQPLCDALTKSHGPAYFRERTGLPPSTYFSATKLRWLLDNVDAVRDAAARGTARCGTIDSWIVYRLTGRHVTDVTNASRTLLMNLATLEWDDELLRVFDIPREMLPEIATSSHAAAYGALSSDGVLGRAVPVTGVLGDQQAALFGQGCTQRGEAKITFGTGCFTLLHTGTVRVPSSHGMLTTVAWQRESGEATYALEGAVAIAGALVQWLRDNLGIISTSSEIETLANSVDDTGGVVIVPAFSGLFAPRWRPDARGTIVGMTQFTTRAHIARAALEAVCHQNVDVIEAMKNDADVELRDVRVDGGMVTNNLLMQMQSDLLRAPIVRPTIIETTALGAAFAAGLAAGVFDDIDALRSAWTADAHWSPTMKEADRTAHRHDWSRAVDRSLGWIES